MKPIQGRCKKSKFAPKEDFISSLPDNVLTNILDRLPLRDAARTAILSSNWRFKWTMLISQLVFDLEFFEYLRETKAENNQERVISRILLQLRGPITKCVLYVVEELDVDDEDVIHWISFLSRKGIKDLTLEVYHKTPFKLPIQLFSCLELKHLTLRSYCLNPPSTFHGFPNLLSLELSADSNGLGEVITRCPLLEILKLDGVSYLTCEVKLDEIAKLENLKVLYLSVCDLPDSDREITSSRTTLELLGSLPKLQQLELDFEYGKLLEGVADKRFSTAFPCLKALKLSNICLDDGMKLSCAFELIMSCPNLQTLEITANGWEYALPPQVDYNTTGMLQLRSVMFEYLKGSENELSLIKYLFASSPFLEKIVIRPKSFKGITSDEKLGFSMKLLKLHRASTVAEIDLF